ncbi:MAG: hypothetical protein NXI16_12765 [Alphaproteobacteria bacterium]|nr:hypothetical protein [Alphaproteobacteria bacterium]
MAKSNSWVLTIGAAVLLTGCSFASDSLLPSLTGEDPAPASAQAIAPSAGERTGAPLIAAAPPRLNTGTFQPQPPTAANPTGTFVGTKIVGLRGDLGGLQQKISQHNGTLQASRADTEQSAAQYHQLVAAINAKLQIGTTPGNPLLAQQWDQSQRQLETLNEDIVELNELSNRVASDSALTAYLLESVRATYGLSGAVDEDHRQLAILEDEVNQTVVLVDRLLNELSEDIERQTTYLNNERRNLQTLAIGIKNGQLYGASLANRAFLPTRQTAAAGGVTGGRVAAGTTALANRRPLVVIRFDRADVEYEQALYTVVNRALERNPAALFDLVAVGAQTGGVSGATLNTSTARRNAERVLRSLVDLGLPSDRVILSTTSSPQVSSNEVRLYAR